LIFAFSEASGDEQILLMLLLIPLFFVSHFYIRFRFGFTAAAAGNRFIHKILDVGAVLVLVLLLGSGVYFITSYLLEQKHERALSAKYSRLKLWDDDTLAYRLKARLETKYEGQFLRYKLTVTADSGNRHRLQDQNSYVINFYDRDGFLLHETRIVAFNVMQDEQGMVKAHVANTTDYFDVDENAQVDSWDLTYIQPAY
jgi:hypothetical protein